MEENVIIIIYEKEVKLNQILKEQVSKLQEDVEKLIRNGSRH